MYFRLIYFFVKCAFVIFFRYSTRSFLGICDRFWLVSFQFNYILCTGHFLSIIIRIEPHWFQRRWISGANFTPLIPFSLLGDKRLLSLQCIIGLLFHINIDINYWCGIFIVQDTQNKRNWTTVYMVITAPWYFCPSTLAKSSAQSWIRPDINVFYRASLRHRKFARS